FGCGTGRSELHAAARHAEGRKNRCRRLEQGRAPVRRSVRTRAVSVGKGPGTFREGERGSFGCRSGEGKDRGTEAGRSFGGPDSGRTGGCGTGPPFRQLLTGEWHSPPVF